eukprot:jgi/Chlat1/2491/Chrsp175S02367
MKAEAYLVAVAVGAVVIVLTRNGVVVIVVIVQHIVVVCVMRAAAADQQLVCAYASSTGRGNCYSCGPQLSPGTSQPTRLTSRRRSGLSLTTTTTAPVERASLRRPSRKATCSRSSDDHGSDVPNVFHDEDVNEGLLECAAATVHSLASSGALVMLRQLHADRLRPHDVEDEANAGGAGDSVQARMQAAVWRQVVRTNASAGVARLARQVMVNITCSEVRESGILAGDFPLFLNSQVAAAFAAAINRDNCMEQLVQHVNEPRAERYFMSPHWEFKHIVIRRLSADDLATGGQLVVQRVIGPMSPKVDKDDKDAALHKSFMAPPAQCLALAVRFRHPLLVAPSLLVSSNREAIARLRLIGQLESSDADFLAALALADERLRHVQQAPSPLKKRLREAILQERYEDAMALRLELHAISECCHKDVTAVLRDCAKLYMSRSGLWSSL